MKLRRKRRWTDADVEQLRRMLADGSSAPAIGRALHRSEKSVRHRTATLGLTTDRRRRWRSDELDQVVELIEQGVPLRRIAPRFDTKPAALLAVLTRRDRLPETVGRRWRKWTPEQDAVLVEMRQQGRTWPEIGAALPGRTAGGAQVHFLYAMGEREWWHLDDARLYKGMVLVDHPGLQAAARLTGRSREQCRMRWQEYFVAKGYAPGSPAPRV